jgi:hypothetical protein
VDANAPKELQKLGRVLQRIMLGDKNVDLSGLREEWREVIQRLALPKDTPVLASGASVNE